MIHRWLSLTVGSFLAFGIGTNRPRLKLSGNTSVAVISFLTHMADENMVVPQCFEFSAKTVSQPVAVLTSILEIRFAVFRFTKMGPPFNSVDIVVPLSIDVEKYKIQYWLTNQYKTFRRKFMLYVNGDNLKCAFFRGKYSIWNENSLDVVPKDPVTNWKRINNGRDMIYREPAEFFPQISFAISLILWNNATWCEDVANHFPVGFLSIS